MTKTGYLYDDSIRQLTRRIACRVYGQMSDGSKVWQEIGQDDTILYELSTRGGTPIFYVLSIN